MRWLSSIRPFPPMEPPTKQSTHRCSIWAQSFPFHSFNLANCIPHLFLNFELSFDYENALDVPFHLSFSIFISLFFSLSLLDRTISDCCENKIKSRINFCPHRLWLITQKLGKMGIPIEIACFIDEMLIGWIPSSLFSFSTPPTFYLPLSLSAAFCVFQKEIHLNTSHQKPNLISYLMYWYAGKGRKMINTRKKRQRKCSCYWCISVRVNLFGIFP